MVAVYGRRPCDCIAKVPVEAAALRGKHAAAMESGERTGGVGAQPRLQQPQHCIRVATQHPVPRTNTVDCKRTHAAPAAHSHRAQTRKRTFIGTNVLIDGHEADAHLRKGRSRSGHRHKMMVVAEPSVRAYLVDKEMTCAEPTRQ
jgi:hypothetical protein